MKENYPYLTKLENCSDWNGATKNLRASLKHYFPNIKFSVRRRSGDNTVYISYFDGPILAQVDKVAQMYCGKSFDGMIDLESIVTSDFTNTFGLLGYIFVEREYSEAIRNKYIEELKVKYPNLKDNTHIDVFFNNYNVSAEDAKAINSGVWVSYSYLFRGRVKNIDLTPIKEDKTAERVEKGVLSEVLELVPYSDKSFAVIGDTKPIKEKLKELGGRFNFRLSCGAGWIFPKTREEVVRAALSL